MSINERLLWAIESYGGNGISGIEIYCSSAKEEIAECFRDSFDRYWKEAEEFVEEEYGNCINKDEEYDNPMAVSITEYGVKVRISNLTLYYDNGDEQVDFDGNGDKALEKTLAELSKRYPDLQYKGYIGYSWSDPLSGAIIQYPISSDGSSLSENEVFSFIGDGLREAVGDDFFWEKLEEQLEDADEKDVEEIRSFFRIYEKWLPEDFDIRWKETMENV